MGKVKTEITFYAGIHTIGGVVMSVVYGEHRVLLEIGTAYEPKTDVYDHCVQPRDKNRLRDELHLRRYQWWMDYTAGYICRIFLN